jgi:hypothetical protein
MYPAFQITLSLSLPIAIIGWLLINIPEDKKKTFGQPFYQLLKQHLKTIYAITTLCFFYFGIGCFLLLFQQ